MIDWYEAVLGIPADGLDAEVIYTEQGDAIEFRSPRPHWAVGSAESRIRLKRNNQVVWLQRWMNTGDWTPAAWDRVGGADTMLEVSGNPSKWLQGHNVVGRPAEFGYALMRQAVREAIVKDQLPLVWPATVPFIPVHRKRADITISVRLRDQAEVMDWLSLANAASRSRFGGTTSFGHGDTVYWQKRSRRWSIKAYSKYAELEHNPIKRNPDLQRMCLAFAAGLLRLELTLRGDELRQYGLLSDKLFWTYWDRLTMARTEPTLLDRRGELSFREEQMLATWENGLDPRQGRVAPSKATFYRYRKKILDYTGKDISLPPPLPSKKKGSGGTERDLQLTADWLQARVENGTGDLPVAAVVEPSLFSDKEEIK